MAGRVGGHDDRPEHLAPPLVGHADHGRLLHGRVLLEDLLDLDGIDVLAAADDPVAPAPDEEQVALVVEAAEVAGAQPAVVVHEEEVGSTGDDLADAGGVGRIDAHLDPGCRSAHGLEEVGATVDGDATVVVGGQAGDRAALGLPVEVDDIEAGSDGQSRRCSVAGWIGDAPYWRVRSSGRASTPASRRISSMVGTVRAWVTCRPRPLQLSTVKPANVRRVAPAASATA